MVKVLNAVLFVTAIVALVAVPGCKSDDVMEGCGCGYAEACGCDACGCGSEACGCGDGCGCAGCGDGCGGCGCGDGCGAAGAVVSGKDATHAMRLYQSYSRWSRMFKDPIKSRQHAGHMVVSFADNKAKGTYRSGEGDYALHAALAKEGWKDGEKKVVWFMQKRKDGYDNGNGNWWYATVSTDGKVMNAGKVAMCIGCHRSAQNDFVYGE